MNLHIHSYLWGLLPLKIHYIYSNSKNQITGSHLSLSIFWLKILSVSMSYKMYTKASKQSYWVSITNNSYIKALALNQTVEMLLKVECTFTKILKKSIIMKPFLWWTASMTFITSIHILWTTGILQWPITMRKAVDAFDSSSLQSLAWVLEEFSLGPQNV